MWRKEREGRIFKEVFFLLESSCHAEILSKLSESKELYLAGMECELMVCLVYDS